MTYLIVYYREDGTGKSAGVVEAEDYESAITEFLSNGVLFPSRLTEDEDFYDVSPREYVCSCEVYE